jgi:hypothetical protein
MKTLRLDPQDDFVRGPMAHRPMESPDADLRTTHANDALASTITSRAFYLLNGCAGALGLFRRPLSARELMSAAERRTGLADFGEWGVEEPLERLIESYEREASLSAFGRIAARWDVLRFLSNLLRLRDDEKRHPEILDQEIARPIFITGLPRAGTSFLHELISEDPANLAVRHWETIFPCSIRLGADDVERRRRKVQDQIKSFERIAPEIRYLHPFTADSPQECTEITGHVFRGMRYDTTHYIPSYSRWLERQSQIVAYRFHKRFLQHIQFRRGPGRWVLKCPEHVFALDSLRNVYPDARFVFTHRNPLSVLPSVARLTETVRQPFTTRLDRHQLGEEVAARWAQGTAIMVETAKSAEPTAEPALHIEFRRFVRDPAAAVAEFYAHFGLNLDAESQTRIRRLIALKPTGGNVRNRGRLEDYGLDAETERKRFADYTAFFGIA